MGEQGLVPLGVERPRPRLKRYLLGERPNQPVPARLVADVDRSRPAPRPAHRASDAAERVEVVIDRSHAQLDGVEVLVRRVDARERVGEHCVAPLGPAAHTLRVALAPQEGVGQLVLVVPRAVVEQVVHVRAVGAVRVAEDAQRRVLDRAAVGRLEGESVRPDEVLLARFVRARREQGGLGEQLGLHRQQVAEDARQHHNDIDPRPSELLQGHEPRPREPPVAVVARLRAEQPERLGKRPALGLQVVRAPEHHGDRLGQAPRLVAMPGEQALGLARAVLDGEGARDAEGVEPVQVAPGRQDLGRAQQVAAGRRADVAAVEGVDQGGELVVRGEQRIE